jgi:4,5-DOPA dioxygenase extradiol
MHRRDALRAIASLPFLGAGCVRQEEPTVSRPTGATGEGLRPADEPRSERGGGRMPVIFAAHGAPMLLDDALWMGELAAWARSLPRPKAILVVSAHWEERPATLGATTRVPLLYDFYGFPEKYYRLQYPAPGAPELAIRVRDLLRQQGIASTTDAERGLDHGAFVPLLAMYPEADLPVLQLSLPGLIPAELLALGAALAPLRDEGVLILGSGFITHNMRYAFVPGTPVWAREFDGWAREQLARLDLDALADFRARAPGAELALPTWEHYAPVLVSAAAAAALGEHAVSFPITGWWMDGAFTKRSVQLG